MGIVSTVLEPEDEINSVSASFPFEVKLLELRLHLFQQSFGVVFFDFNDQRQ